MNQKFPQFSAILRVFAVVLTCLFSVAAATAQDEGVQVPTPSTVANPSATAVETEKAAAAPVPVTPADESTKAVVKRATDPIAVSASGASDKVTAKEASTTPGAEKEVKPADNYKASLNSLSTLYQNEVQRLEQKNAQAKELLQDGLISRVDMEASDKALTDARAKVDEVAKQIVEANKPAPVLAASNATATLASNQVWSTGNNRVDNLIRYYGNQHGVDPYLIYCLMSQESKFSTIAISPKGAQGLMQLMPGTAARYGVTNPYDLAQNISGGTRYLKDLLKMFNGRVDLALAGYNAGENAVIKYGYAIPPYQETRNYVKLIVKRYGATQANAQSQKTKI